VALPVAWSPSAFSSLGCKITANPPQVIVQKIDGVPQVVDGHPPEG
jgi:hypothetical protein